jgi:hypothetical protein
MSGMTALAEILAMVDWSPWAPLAAVAVPAEPGVYLVRRAADGAPVYVGMAAGERRRGHQDLP